jgi:molybdenum cofactor biosynthesis enzyme MoaA
VHRYSRQANFDLPDSRFKPLTVDGEAWRVYDNANLSVHLGDACNADCQFCIAHLRYIDTGRTYHKPVLKRDAYLERLRQLLTTVAPVAPSVSITGGEPTIHPLLPDVLDVLREAGVRKRTMTTNGTGLLRPVTGPNDTVLDRLAKYRLEHLNISRAHQDFARNAEIMRLKDGLDDAALREVIAEARRQDIRVRLSCALLKEGVSTVDQMEEYLDWAAKIGCDNVIFRQLMAFDTGHTTGHIPEYCSEQSVSLTEVWEELDKRPEFVLTHSVLGYYYYVEIRQRRGIDVASEMADLRLIDSQIDRFAIRFNTPLAFEMVIHPNGNLCASWFEDHRVMSEYQDA